MLQWGRNFFVTEIGFLPKKLQPLFALQWGRNFFVTEIGSCVDISSVDIIASMGP